MHNANDYEIHIWYSHAQGDQCFVAQVAEWPPLTAMGDTREEAAREIQIVLELALASANDADVPPPAPRLIHA